MVVIALVTATISAIIMAIDAWDASGSLRDVQAADAVSMVIVIFSILLDMPRRL